MKNKIKISRNNDQLDFNIKRKTIKHRVFKKDFFDTGVVTDSNGHHIKVGDFVCTEIKNGPILSDCEVIEIKENGLIKIAYDDIHTNKPIQVYEVASTSTTLL